MKLKGGQEHKIDNFEGNNELTVLLTSLICSTTWYKRETITYLPFRTSNLGLGRLKGQKWDRN